MEVTMLTRRRFLANTLKGSSLLTLGAVVPDFLATTALAAETGKDTVLVVVELTGGNDGLNTVIPHGDDLYHKARPTLRFTKEQVVRLDDHVGLNPAMSNFKQMLDKGQLAVVQGVGYPNPDHSHFEAMDIWQSADPSRRSGTGWIGRSVPELQNKQGDVPIMQIGPKQLPLALQGTAGSAVSINNQQPFRLELNNRDPNRRYARQRLLKELAQPQEAADKDSLLAFVRRRQVHTYATLDRLQEVLRDLGLDGSNRQNGGAFQPPPPVLPNSQFADQVFGTNALTGKLQLAAHLIAKGFGTRVFYVSLDGFDTHSNQAPEQNRLLAELANGITQFFTQLQQSGHDKRVVLLTFSEFGRRVQENGSRGTDHGAASCLFVAGPAVKGGVVGKHPSLSDLDFGDLKHHTDFRRIYATLLDNWLGCDSRIVLGSKFEAVDLLKKKA
jgi:uncharacterized protein (DUF1501 family)